MGLAPYIYADRSLTKFGDDGQLERLHRVFYPVFRVDFSYETGKSKILGTERKDEHVGGDRDRRCGRQRDDLPRERLR